MKGHTMAWTSYVLFAVLFLLDFIANAATTGITCDFEHGLCGWQPSPSRDFDWLVGNGPTPDRTSGPRMDHTKGTLAGKYLYIKSREARHRDWEAVITNNITAESAGETLEFWYFMNGNGVGTLEVRRVEHSGQSDTLWTRKGRQGIVWKKASVTLPEGQYMLEFLATSEFHYGGDIAIDDILLLDNSLTTVSTTEKTTAFSPLPLLEIPFSCTFDADLCGLKALPSIASTVLWERRAGNVTFNGKTYISGDKTMGKGHYLLLNSSADALSDDTATLVFPTIQDNSSLCLTLYYIMPTSRSGTISVYQKFSERNSKLIYEISGSQGNDWMLMYLTIEGKQAYKVIIEGTNSGVPYSVLGIDDVHLKYGPCVEYTTRMSTTPPTTTPTLPPITISHRSCSDGITTPIPELTCDFSKDYCDFKHNPPLLSISWYRTNSTKYFKSSKSSDDNFLYANTDSWYAIKNTSASLTSGYAQGSHLCLEFKYILKDKSSNLEVIAERSTSQLEVIWRSPNTVLNKWKLENLNINVNDSIKVIFKSTKKDNKGIVGLDNIKGFTVIPVTTPTSVSVTTPSSATASTVTQNSSSSMYPESTTAKKSQLYSTTMGGVNVTTVPFVDTPTVRVTESTESNTKATSMSSAAFTLINANVSKIFSKVTQTLPTGPQTKHVVTTGGITLNVQTVTSSVTTETKEGNGSGSRIQSSHVTEVVVGAVVPLLCAAAVVVILVFYSKKIKRSKVEIKHTSPAKYISKDNMNGEVKSHTEKQNGTVEYELTPAFSETCRTIDVRM